MKVMNDAMLQEIVGGGDADLPIVANYTGPSDSYIAAILALLAPRWPVHASD